METARSPVHVEARGTRNNGITQPCTFRAYGLGGTRGYVSCKVLCNGPQRSRVRIATFLCNGATCKTFCPRTGLAFVLPRRDTGPNSRTVFSCFFAVARRCASLKLALRSVALRVQCQRHGRRWRRSRIGGAAGARQGRASESPYAPHVCGPVVRHLQRRGRTVR